MPRCLLLERHAAIAALCYGLPAVDTFYATPPFTLQALVSFAFFRRFSPCHAITPTIVAASIAGLMAFRRVTPAAIIFLRSLMLDVIDDAAVIDAPLLLAAITAIADARYDATLSAMLYATRIRYILPP